MTLMERRRALMAGGGEVLPVQEIRVNLLSQNHDDYYRDSQNRRIRTNYYIPINPNYLYQEKNNNTKDTIYWYDESKTLISSIATNFWGSNNITPPSNARYAQIRGGQTDGTIEAFISETTFWRVA